MIFNKDLVSVEGGVVCLCRIKKTKDFKFFINIPKVLIDEFLLEEDKDYLVVFKVLDGVDLDE